MIKLRAVLRRRWTVLLAGLVVGALAGVLSAALAPEGDAVTRYRVSQLIVANNSSAPVGGVEQDALRVTRGEVAASAAATLGEDDPALIGSLVSATANAETNTIEVSATNIDPEVATDRVEAFVSAFLDVVNGDALAEQERELAQYQEQLDIAVQRLAAFDAANPQPSASTDPGQQPDPFLADTRGGLQAEVTAAEQQLRDRRLNAERTLPYSTLGPDAPQNAASDLLPVPTGIPFRVALLGLFGLALSFGLILLVERLVPRIDTRDELVDAADFPVLAEVGHFPSRKLPHDADGTLRLEGAWAEPYRRIRSAIQFVQASSNSEHPPKVFMFTSPSPSEGKSTTTAVTGLALAEAGEPTLVVGGDFRRPSVHKLLGSPSTPGIREHARLDIDRPTSQQIVHSTAHEHLYVAPSGVAGREVVGMADAARSLIAEAVAEGATVVIDTSPVEVANDAVDLLPAVDEVILVVRSGRTTLKALTHTVEQLQLHGARIMGTALIGTPGVAKQQYYYEGYYADGDTRAGGTDDSGPLFPEEAPAGTEQAPPATDASDAEDARLAPASARNGSAAPAPAPSPVDHLPPPPGSTPAEHLPPPPGWSPPPQPQS